MSQQSASEYSQQYQRPGRVNDRGVAYGGNTEYAPSIGHGECSATSPAEWQPDVLPIFYYNDLMVSQPGDPIGLNLFEPRYQIMCRRMAHDGRFLFMPNFEDYCCRAGDVGLVIKLTNLRQRGGSFGIQGVAESYAAVACTWVEPGTHGLHHARFWSLGTNPKMLKYEELRALLEVLFDDRGWQKIDTGSFRLLMQAPQRAMPQGGGHMPEVGQLTVGLNWGHPQGRIAGTFLILRSGDPELLRKLEEAWTAAMPKLGRLRIPAANFIEHAVHQVPCAKHGPSLEEVCGDLLHAISTDGAGARHLIGLADEGPPANSAWRRLLAALRISMLSYCDADLETARLELEHSQPGCVEDCFLHREERGNENAMVHVSNGTNVRFYADLHDVRISSEQAAAAVATLIWQLNRDRLQLLYRARDAGQGPLAMFEDDVAQLVCDFVAPDPRR